MKLNVRFGEIYEVPQKTEDTYILIDENGNEIVACLVDEVAIFDATENDIRQGKVAATAEGVTTGTKVIPSYNTSEGVKLIKSGYDLNINIQQYDYTKLQALVCFFNSDITNSVATDKVAIDDSVYNVQSTEKLSVVVKNDVTKEIELGITNSTGNPLIIRYMCYKEIY